MATWARGVSFKNSDNTKNIGGIGIYGNDTTAEKLYIGLGTEPWNNAGVQLTNSTINFKGNKIYHAGDKPTLSDIGAAAASHNHTSLSGVSSIAFNAQSSDGVSIKTIINESATYLDMFMYDDVNQDKFRWRFKPHSSDSTLMVERSLMELYCKTASTANTAHLDLYGSFKATDTITAPTFSGSLAGNASTATKLQTAKSINGTNFDGSGNITTENWGTARNIAIGRTTKSVNGSANVSWSTDEIGALDKYNDSTLASDKKIFLGHSTSWLTGSSTNGTVNLEAGGNLILRGDRDCSAVSEFVSLKAGNNDLRVISSGSGTGQDKLTFNGNIVYHAGKKPTAAEIGAAESSHTHNYIIHTNETTASITAKDHGDNTWFRNSSGMWTFQSGTNGDDWTQSFQFNLIAADSNVNSQWMEIGQQKSNAADGRYRGISLVKFAGSKKVAGDLSVGDILGPDKTAFRLGTDSWLRINDTNSYSSGVYLGTSNVRTDGRFEIVRNNVTWKVTNDNGSFTHYRTTATEGHWFDKNVRVAGEIYAGAEYNKRVYHEGNKPSASDIGAAASNHSHSNYLPLSGGTVTGAITSSLTTSTHLAGNKGTAIINSTAAGSGYTMLAKMNSTNGVWTMGGYGSNFCLMYTANSVISAGTNNVTKSVTLLNEGGNSYFPGTVTAPTFSGNLSGNANTATTLQNTRTINGTNFNGSADITTAKWGTARNITIGNAKKSIDGSADATWTVAEIGAAASNHTHSNYVPTSEYGLTTISKTLTIETNWMDTGITGANLASGSYMVQVSGMSSDATGFYSEIWTGVMSWYNASTNSTDADEIVLHKAGHASNGRTIYLRTLRVASSGTLKLQICASTALKSTNITFKFRKLI